MRIWDQCEWTVAAPWSIRRGLDNISLWKEPQNRISVNGPTKVRTFMLATFGDDILTALTWAARQQRIVAKTCAASQRNRMKSWITVFGDRAGEAGIENIDDCGGKLFALACVFYNRRTQQNCPKFWRRKWFGSLETTAQRARSDIIHETCGDPSASSEPSSVPTCRRLGICS